MAALGLSEDDVLNFLVSRGGEVPNADLRKHFRDFLESGDAEMRERSRQCFKQCVNAVATVTKTNGATCVRLRKRFAALLKGGTSGAGGQRRSDRRSSQEQMNLQRQGQGDRMGSREGQGDDCYLEDRRSDEHYFIPGEEQSHHLNDSMGAGSASSWASSPPGSLMSAQVGSYGEEERRGYYCAVGEGQVAGPEPGPVPSDAKPLDFSKGFGIVLVGSSLAEAAQQVGEWRIGDEQGGVSSHRVQAGSSTGASQFLRGDECRESAGLVSDERTGGFAPDTVSGLTDGWEPAVAAWEAQSKYSNSSDARPVHGEHWQVIPDAIGQSESNTDDIQSERVSLSDQWAMPSHALEPHVHVDQWHEIHGATGQMESSTEQTSQWSRNTAIEDRHQREVLPFEYSHGDSVTHPHSDGHRDQMQLEQPYWEGQSLPEHIHRDGNITLERPDTHMYISPGANYNSSYGREEQSISERQCSDCWSTSGYYGPAVGVYDSGVEPGTQFESHEREWSDNHDHVRERTRPYVEAAVGRLRTDVPRGGWQAAQDLYLNEPNPQGSQPSEENMYMTLETRGGGGSVGQGAEYWHRAHDPPLHGAGWHHLQRDGERATIPDWSRERADDYLELERTDRWNKQYPQPGSEIPSIMFTRDNDPQRGVAMTKVNAPAFVRVEPLPQSTSQFSRRSDSSQEWRESELDVRLSTPAESEMRRSSAQHSQHDLNRNDYEEKMEVEKKHAVTRRVDILPETLADAQHSRRPDVNAPQGKLLPPPPLYAMMSRYLSSSELRSRGDPRLATRENQPLPIATSSRSRSFPSLRFDIPPDATEDDLAEKEKRSMRESQNVTAAGEQRPWFQHSSQSPRMHQDQFKQHDYDHRQEGSLQSYASSDRRQPSTTEVAGRGIPMFIKHALTQGRRPRQRAKALMEKSHSLVNLQHGNQWESVASYQQPANFLGATAEYPELFSEKSKSLRDLYEYSVEIGREGHPRDWNVVHVNAREPLRETGRRAVLEKSKSLRDFQSTDQPYSFQNQYRPDDHRFSLTDQTLVNRSEDRGRLVLEKSRSLKDVYQSDQDFKFQDNHHYAGDPELKPAREHPSVPPTHYILPEKSSSLRDLHQNDNHFEHHREVRRNERDFHNPAVRTQSLGRDSHILEESKAMGDIQSHHMERHQDEFHKRPDLGYTDTRPKVWTYPPLEDSESSLEGQDMFVPNLLPDRDEVHPGHVSTLVSCDDGAILDKPHPRRSTQSDVDNIPPLFAKTMETVPTEPRAPSPVLLTVLPVTSEQLSGDDQTLIERQQGHYDSEDDNALADNLRRVAAEIVHSPLRTRAQVTRAAWKQQQQQQQSAQPLGEHSLAPSSSSSSAAPGSQDNNDDDPSYGSADEAFASNVRRVAKGLLTAQTGGGGQSHLSRQGSRMWKKPVVPVDWGVCVPQEVSRINELLTHSTSRNNLRKQQQQQQLVEPKQQDKVKKVVPVHLDTAPAGIERGGPARETRVRERSRDRLQPETLSRVQRVWMLSAVRGDFRSLFRVMKTNPDLLLTKDLVSGFTALHWAAKHGDTNALIVLYQQLNKTRPPHALGATGPGVEEPRSRVGHTPLHVAAMCGHKEVMRLLVNRFGAFVGARDAAGRRPGQYLPASSSSADIITLLDYRPGLARPVAAPSPGPLRAAKKTGVSLASSQSMSRKSVMSVMFGHGSEDGHFVKPGRPKSSYLS